MKSYFVAMMMALALVIGASVEPSAAVTRAERTPADPFAFRAVGMAGGFNNWNTGDRATTMMKKARGKYELVRFFEKGSWIFKFVMNNGWNVHRGLSVDGSRLEQPGRDIQLSIPAPGFYKIALDLNRETWTLTPAPALSAVALVDFQAEYSLGREITLDASRSLARPGRRISRFVWKQDPRDDAKLSELPKSGADSRLILNPSTPGLYRIKLTVNDGKAGLDREILFRVASSYQVVDPANELFEMERLEDGRFRYTKYLGVNEDFPWKLCRNFDLGSLHGATPHARTDLELALKVDIVSGGDFIVVAPARAGLVDFIYDPRTEEATVQRSRLTRIVFDPRSSERLHGVAVEKASVAGSFNGWNAKANPMKLNERGAYEALLDLADGAHQYKIVVNDEIWLANPLAPAGTEQPDGMGGFNSTVTVGERGSDYGEAGHGINAAALRHDPASDDYFNAYSKRKVELKLRTLASDVAEAYCLVERETGIERVRMERISTRSGFDYFVCDAAPTAGSKMKYVFEVVDPPARLYLAAGGAARTLDDAKRFEREVRMGFETPDWAKNVIWYQIMVDRWRNGDPRNDPDSSLPWTWDWFKPYTRGESKAFYGGDGVWHRNFGGDLHGLIRSLEYLEDLGVTGIYLNPMFEAPGHHKYNTADYRHIDDNFGTKGDVAIRQRTETSDSRTWAFTPTDTMFLKFLEIAHAHGFKVIIDGVFNHSGTDFWAFRDLVRRGRRSPYRDWFSVKEWDVVPASPGAPNFVYEGWAGFAGLPEYREDENGLAHGIKEHIFDITRRWMDPNGDGDPSDGVDGWRLDVPENVNERFWREWRKVVKGVNPEAYISGEIWENAASRLRGDHYDAVMNYEFLKRVHAFFLPGGTTPAISAGEFARSIEEMLTWYPTQSVMVLQNLLSSHDVDRIASAIHNRAGWKRGRVQDENPSYDTGPPSDRDYEILKQIAVFQFAWPGAPMVYYGDEVGMYGADDPTNRTPMWWNEYMPYQNRDYRTRRDLRDHYQRLMAIRNTYPALRTGRTRFLFEDNTRGIIAFERWDENDRVIVVINNSDSFAPVTLTAVAVGEYVDLLPPRNARLGFGPIEGMGAMRQSISIDPGAVRLTASANGLSMSLLPRGMMVLRRVER